MLAIRLGELEKADPSFNSYGCALMLTLCSTNQKLGLSFEIFGC
jgi:hypothetical protein